MRLVLGKVYEKCTKIKESVILRNIEESNINWKPLIWYQDKIITKFGQKKKIGEFYFGQSVQILPEN